VSEPSQKRNMLNRIVAPPLKRCGWGGQIDAIQLEARQSARHGRGETSHNLGSHTRPWSTAFVAGQVKCHSRPDGA
jgi:hypothetical protein